MARTGMSNVIQTVRDLAAAGSADYTVGAATYWTDNQLQDVLDRRALHFYGSRIYPVREIDSGGTARYYRYTLDYGQVETTTGGTSVFFVQEPDGSFVGTASYTVDYNAGRVTFGSDTAGSALLFTYVAYDVHLAAADVWRQKAGHVAHRFDFTADGSSFKASQLTAHYLAMADFHENRSATGAVQTVSMYRDDVETQAGGW